MKERLSENEINKLVADTIDKIEAKKGTNTAPYIQMDLSMYDFHTLEAIKEAFLSEGIRFQDRWNNGSDFVVPVEVFCAPSPFRSGRKDSFTRSGNGILPESNKAKKSSLAEKVQYASSRALEADSISSIEMKNKVASQER